MCNLYDIGPTRHARRNDWERALAAAAEKREKIYGIRKTDPGMVLVPGAGGPEAKTMSWGFVRNYNPSVNNARSEKLDGTWSVPWKEKRRCLIPLATYYEWSGPTGKKQTFALQSPDPGEWLWAAGLWEAGESGAFYSMITRAASPSLEFLHDRMPTLLNPSDFDEFLQADDPRHLFVGTEPEVSFFRCKNPLLHPSRHQGPEPIDMLPGF
jgi:putative SOS response-associated peptidase YedK